LIFDWDDFHEGNHKLERFEELKRINPLFRCTVFAVPGLGSDAFWDRVPDWIELAVHGWTHPDSYECLHWDRKRIERLTDERIVREHFVRGFKAPGWQISDACYEILLERGWWVADQAYNNERRPAGLKAHIVGGPDHWHGHIQNVCGNGLEETWPQLTAAVRDADSFQLISEVAR